jgi:hypothetical protein
MDETKRQTILRLLADEEAKLASLDNPPQRDGPPQLGLGYPFPPVRGLHINLCLVSHFCPPTQKATAWKDERMRTLSIDDGQLKVPVKWCVGYRLPVHCGI